MGRRKHKQLQFLVLGAAGAGKTSLLRRYFYKQFHSDRAPTVGADFYVGRVPQKQSDCPSHDDHEDPLSVQMWDTPGKENFAIRRRVQASLKDSFFEHADAIMLVYDMTSSTSFTRLLKWYADLLALFARKSRSVPILLVANKLDLFEKGNPRKPPKMVPQRQVLGLGRGFYGHDFHYEYSVSPPNSADISTATETSEDINPLNRTTKSSNNKRRMEISNYFLVNRDNWTSDFSYLESLITAEDGSHPDREMVLLWCMRNSLQLYEVSAATGDGVDEAVLALANLAQSSQDVALEQPASPQRNEELDVRNRYAPERVHCFFSFMPIWRGPKENPPSW